MPEPNILREVLGKNRNVQSPKEKLFVMVCLVLLIGKPNAEQAGGVALGPIMIVGKLRITGILPVCNLRVNCRIQCLFFSALSPPPLVYDQIKISAPCMHRNKCCWHMHVL
jgi:hypothetical protein